MLTPQLVGEILSPYDLELTEEGKKVKSKKFEFGTVGVETIYEMMFIHNRNRDEALTDIANLLNTEKKTTEEKILPKKEKVKKTGAA